MRVLLLERRKKLSSLILVASAWHWDKIFSGLKKGNHADLRTIRHDIIIIFTTQPPHHQPRKVVLDYCRRQFWQLEGVASCIWWPASHGSPKLRKIRASFNQDHFLLCVLKHFKGFLRVPRQFIKSVL